MLDRGISLLIGLLIDLTLFSEKHESNTTNTAPGCLASMAVRIGRMSRRPTIMEARLFSGVSPTTSNGIRQPESVSLQMEPDLGSKAEVPCPLKYRKT